VRTGVRRRVLIYSATDDGAPGFGERETQGTHSIAILQTVTVGSLLGARSPAGPGFRADNINLASRLRRLPECSRGEVTLPDDRSTISAVGNGYKVRLLDAVEIRSS